MRAAVFDRFGEPAEVVRIQDVPTPEPGPNRVRVRMIASPVNPSDLLFTRGRYSIRPTLPASPGFEGVGVVDAAGPGLIGKALVGRRVAVINGEGGNWADFAVVPAFQAIPVPGSLADEQVASFFVNPATVLAMVRHELGVPRGEWLLQSAANSELGKMIVRLGRHDGFKTINVVRRPEAADELHELGADAVIVTADGPIPDQVRRVVGPEGVRFAVDPVGGDIGTGVFESLAPSGTLLAYGSLTGEPIRIDTRLMISGGRVLRGFWLGHFMRSRSKVAAVPLFAQVGRLIRQGVLSTSVGPSFPLDRLPEAVRAAEEPGKPGKVLLRLRASDAAS
ncbi:zinc-dependent alcohol dehydrogenase family protein [Tautonia sp. JC769]|uniref:zinc-dependent alcohol dehydrogenase family protein n=1 Tax=Tautonia sp. JC769 TaxID=3232135 RepID=UPI00345A9DD3